MKENFSKGVQRVLKFAKEEAVRLGHSYVGSEHILLGNTKYLFLMDGELLRLK